MRRFLLGMAVGCVLRCYLFAHKALSADLLASPQMKLRFGNGFFTKEAASSFFQGDLHRSRVRCSDPLNSIGAFGALDLCDLDELFKFFWVAV